MRFKQFLIEDKSPLKVEDFVIVQQGDKFRFTVNPDTSSSYPKIVTALRKFGLQAVENEKLELFDCDEKSLNYYSMYNIQMYTLKNGFYIKPRIMMLDMFSGDQADLEELKKRLPMKKIMRDAKKEIETLLIISVDYVNSIKGHP